ncbi:MAG: hypothetical protein ABIJ09_06405 [Pseudomonadota bacterium]
MKTSSLNWKQLLHRITEHRAVLAQLESFVAERRLEFSGFFAVLLESGFTIPEAQELYTLLRA